MKILTIEEKKEEKFLRRKTADFDFSKFTRKEIDELVRKMREVMKRAPGIGLAANQVGCDFSVFVAQIPKSRDRGSDEKFYAIFNPKITKYSAEKSVSEEGCLSVPGGVYGAVERSSKIVLEGFDKKNKKIKIKAWGLLARVFQHETDHLNGKLFVDRTKNIYKVENPKR